MKLAPSRTTSLRRSASGFALLVVVGFSAISLLALAGVIAWSSGNSKQIERNNLYFTSVSAAEAATEKVLTRISQDFQQDGESLVFANIANYRQLVPSSAESSFWSGWDFQNGAGTSGRTLVERQFANVFTNLESQYTGLRGMASGYRIIANARQTNGSYNFFGAVGQEVQVANIPVFQFAIFYNLDMEIMNGPDMTVNGRVHSNRGLYTDPAGTLTFNTHVTAVGDIRDAKAPGDSRALQSGAIVYNGEVDSKTMALTMPIGTNNTPEAVRAILQTPPGTEASSSLMGKQRFYNKSDLIITVNTNGVSIGTGLPATVPLTLSSNEVNFLATTNGSFWDEREGKTIRPLNLDVGNLRTFSASNTLLRVSLGNRDVRSVYVRDLRPFNSANLAAVRVRNGQTLPDLGLTVSTERPIYVQGHYNQPTSGHLGTTNTSNTKPAALLGDSINILSSSWSDSNSTNYSARNAGNTTVNAAFLAGIVESKTFSNYSGGVENFPRFLENWSSDTLTYNGSMVVMFPSQYATNRWGKANVYSPPTRNWAFDLNFMDSTKLPPGTPELRTLIRGKWQIIAPGQTNMVTMVN